MHHVKSPAKKWQREHLEGKTLQSRDYCLTFAKTLNGLAGDSLDAKQVALYRETR